jgi:hypothetical protein
MYTCPPAYAPRFLTIVILTATCIPQEYCSRYLDRRTSRLEALRPLHAEFVCSNRVNSNLTNRTTPNLPGRLYYRGAEL